jgi:hypothetical protein
MTEQQNAKLREVIASTIAKVRKYQDRGLGEQNTKASLIEPVIEALGWDIRDPDEVHREFKPTSRDCPVDYALKLLRKPRLFVEAKGLGEVLSDRKWIAQVLGYAIVAGVEWCVLSDGNEYRFYNATAPVDAEEKLFCSIKLSDGDVEKTLSLISRSNMEENLIDVLWNAHFVDRRVKLALQQMFATSDRGLIRLIRKMTPNLEPKEIGESLCRLDLRVESLSPMPESGQRRPAAASKPRETQRRPRPTPESKRAQQTKTFVGVALKDVIAAGVLKTPLKLNVHYKGHDLEADLLPDGTVNFQGKNYPTPSAGAEVARSTITGRRMSTNGWIFWKYRDDRGKLVLLDDARQRYLKRKAN